MTAQRRRPTDADYEAAREAVIAAAHEWKRTRERAVGTTERHIDSCDRLSDLIGVLEAIEAARAAYPAISGDGVSGWNIAEACPLLREQKWFPADKFSLQWRDNRHQEREQLAYEMACGHCGAVGLIYSLFRRQWVNPAKLEDLHINACRTCGYWMEHYE